MMELKNLFFMFVLMLDWAINTTYLIADDAFFFIWLYSCDPVMLVLLKL